MLNLVKAKTIPLELHTERLLLRRYQPEDATDLYRAAIESVAEVGRFLPWCHPGYTLNEAEDWVADVIPKWDRGEEYNFAITSRATGRFLGGCGLNGIALEHVANLGYWIRTSEAGKGHVTEATIALANFALIVLKLQRVEIFMSTQNPASQKVAIRAGATFEGVMRRRLNLHGVNHDAYLYSLIQPDLTVPHSGKPE